MMVSLARVASLVCAWMLADPRAESVEALIHVLISAKKLSAKVSAKMGTLIAKKI